jgi:hypothetical protein
MTDAKSSCFVCMPTPCTPSRALSPATEAEGKPTPMSGSPPPSPNVGSFRRNDPYAACCTPTDRFRPSSGNLENDDFAGTHLASAAAHLPPPQLDEPSTASTNHTSDAHHRGSSSWIRSGRPKLPTHDTAHNLGVSRPTTIARTIGNQLMDTQALLRKRSICQYLQYPPLFPVSNADLERQSAFLNELPPHLLESVLFHSNLMVGAEAPMSHPVDCQAPPIARTHSYLATYLPFLPYPSFADGTTALPASYPALDPHSSTSALFIPTLEELLSGLGYDDQVIQPIDFDTTEADLRSSSPGDLHCKFHRRLFVGNIKKDIPLRFLQWLLELVSTPTAHQPADFSPPANAAYLYDASIHRHASNSIFKGCIHVTLATNEDPEIHLQLLHRRVLFDHNGVWFATSDAERWLLQTYCTVIGRLPEASPFRAPMGSLPRSAMSWEEASNRDNARCTRRAETQEAFVQQLLESRVGSGRGHFTPKSSQPWCCR